MKKLNIKDTLKKIATKRSGKKITTGKFVTTLLVFISRFGFLPANLSPLGSFGFLGQNFFLYFTSIILFDLIKGGFYSGFLFTYFGFFAYWLFGKLAKNQKQKLILLPFASFSFFIISNFGVWWNWYPHSISGLLNCYLLAIPFYRNTLIGDLVFTYGSIALKKITKNLAEIKTSPQLIT